MPDRTLSTVRNAVRVLTALAETGPQRLTALSTKLGLGKSAVHLLLQTLREDGFVDFDPTTTTYRIGLQVFEIGATAVEQGGFGARLIGAMEVLSRQSNESVSLGVLNAGSVLFVQRIESPNILRADIRLGSRMPLHASASGKALLAAMSDDDVSNLLPASLPTTARRTVSQLPVLLSELRDIRQRGYACQVEEFVDGIAALAAPVYDASGRVLAALSIAGPAGRFDEARWANLLMPAASQMSQLCGYHAHLATFGSNGHSAKVESVMQSDR